MKATYPSASFRRKFLSLTFCLSLLAAQSPAFGATADEAKLKELEQAMKTAPKADNPVKKPRTRAIVFDNEPAAAQTADQSSAAGQNPAPAQIGTQAAVKNHAPIDCAKIAPDVKATAVDFAINFKVNSAEIAPSSEVLLQQIAKILNLSPERCVLVEGHTDASGNHEKNMSLSSLRANAVVKFISEQAGVEGKRLVAIGKGPTEPLKNTDPRDAKNRRVVFKVVD